MTAVLDAEKKRIERYVLAAARNAGVPIPIGEIAGEEPDFKFGSEAASLGIELSELLRPASTNHGILPVEEETYHKAIVQAAQEEYLAASGFKPLHVRIYFESARGKKRDKWEMSRALVKFVKANAYLATPFVTSYEVPEGFASITISSDIQLCDWWSGECGGYTIDDIRLQLAKRINDKNRRLPKYRANLPKGAQVWLLTYSLVTVSRSMSIPHGIEGWRFPFQFDRVFWFTCLEREFVEIQRASLCSASE